MVRIRVRVVSVRNRSCAWLNDLHRGYLRYPYPYPYPCTYT